MNRVNLATVARKAQDPNQRSPYVQQYNFGVQREISRTWYWTSPTSVITA